MPRTRPVSDLSLPSIAVLAALLFLLLAGAEACAPTNGGAQALPPKPVDTGSGTVTGEPADWDAEARWKNVAALVDEQKFQAASEEVRELLDEARKREDTENWTRGLIELVQLETALHGYEKAVRLLRDEPWPDDPLSVAALELYYAQGLVHYLQVYSWEVRKREEVSSSAEVDLKNWTSAQIVAEADRAYRRVWARRADLGGLGLKELSRYLAPNNYPGGIRDTLRDAVTYLWVELLADSSLWSANESNGLFRLDVEDLLRARADGSLVEDGSAHPLRRLVALLADLEEWHGSQRRGEAEFEARLERQRRLHSALSTSEDRRAIREDLEDHLDRLGSASPWWSMGKSQLAGFFQADSDDPWALVLARRIASEGERAHPGSVGGARCRHLVAQIEAPSFSITAMSTDGAQRRSIEIRHKNLDRLFFRAYALDLFDLVEGSKDYRLLPGYREVEELTSRRSPVAEWSTELAETPDFREHRTFSVPALGESGFYLVVASANRSFGTRSNEVQAVYLNRSDLVLVSREDQGALEVEVTSGSSGEPIQGAEVHLYRYNYRRKGHHRADLERSGADGRVRFERSHDGNNYFLLARKAGEVALDQSRRYFHRPGREGLTSGSFLYTDRSIYRPGQDVLWKVVGYQGERTRGDLEVLRSRSIQVRLFDANNEEVAETTVLTNEYGSASGSFEIPAGRLLGGWSLRSSLGGASSLRVEEYKRPTFEATLAAPDTALRLNRKASLSGDAKYYFGLPVVDGEVEWRVTREPIYPYWWWWYRPPAAGAPETIAAGSSSLSEDGTFSFDFLPEADEREAANGVSYRFKVAAEVTDSGGETAKAERVFRLGFVTVEARVELDGRFAVAGAEFGVDIVRQDLDGIPRPGNGSWRLVKIDQPGVTPLPADIEVPDSPKPVPSEAAHRTEGDRLRARWQGLLDPVRILRLWPDGAEMREGSVSHDDEGQGRVDVGALEPGAYRLHYSTQDAFGAEFASRHEFVVAHSGVERGGEKLALPAVLMAERGTVKVGETARILVHSGLERQRLVFELFRHGKRFRREVLDSSDGLQVLAIPITEADRGGLGMRLTAVRDHQLMTLQENVFVPWDDKRLEIEFASFRDYLRPGGRETWRVTVKGVERDLAHDSAELLAYMYDRSLDVFAPHLPPDPQGIYPRWGRPAPVQSNLSASSLVWRDGQLVRLPGYPTLHGDRLAFLSGYGIGGMGRRGFPGRPQAMRRMMSVTSESPMLEDADAVGDLRQAKAAEEGEASAPETREEASTELRSDFSETAFWEPHLLLEPDGSVAFEFEVPDSVTEWNVWVHAVTNDLRSGRTTQQVKTVKDLLVRPYLPRFLREGDRAEIRLVVQNAGEEPFSGSLDFELSDPATGEDLLAAFSVSDASASGLAFSIEPEKSQTFTVPLATPVRLGEIAVKVVARAGELSDGELRPLPVLPGRMHLAQSRFVTLKDRDRKSLHFADLARDDDDTRIDEQMVVTLDTQLFYSVLSALPYLVNYPYECTEQTMNRFLSTGIVSTLYDDYPAVKRMARKFSARESRLEPWQPDDPNRKMTLEETPWLAESRGGGEPGENLINVLDPKIASAQRKSALAKLRKAQTSLGGFPWFPGGPPSPYMTLYLLNGFSRALEFDVEVPKPMVKRAWAYMHRHYLDEVVEHMMALDCCWEFVTFLNYVLSSYPDESWTGGVFTEAERERMLEFSFRHWKSHSPLLKAQLALTLEREGRSADARLVFDSVMDSAKTTDELGTFWAREDRSWLWYNDTIESHAFALRTLTELDEADNRREGLVQWLLLNKKLNHWKSTRGTAEVVYSLVHYLEAEGTLAAREEVQIAVGERTPRTFVFEPDEYTGKNNQIVVPGEEIDPATDSTVVVEKETPGFAFASATWHFSTEKVPTEARGDFFEAHRTYFRRVSGPSGWTLQPLAEGASIEVGDQVEVHVSIRAKHAAEYVHLRDPRPAGFEPERSTSGYKWDLGLIRYEEVRDSGMNFFFERLPVGEYTMKHRLRAATAGTFQSAPATLQSMYAPEFTAYSAGDRLTIEP